MQQAGEWRRLTGDYGVCTGDGRDDVLDDSLRQAPGDAFDVVLLRSGEGLRVKPLDVGWVIVVDLAICRIEFESDVVGQKKGGGTCL